MPLAVMTLGAVLLVTGCATETTTELGEVLPADRVAADAGSPAPGLPNDEMAGPADAGPTTLVDCSGPAWMHLYSPEGTETPPDGRALAALPGQVVARIGPLLLAFEAGADAPPEPIEIGLSGHRVLGIEARSRALFAIYQRYLRDRLPELSAWRLEAGDWRPASEAVRLQGHLLDARIAAAGPAAAVLDGSETELTIVGVGVDRWALPHSGWRSPARVFPDEGFVVTRDEARGSPLRLHPFDFSAGAPLGDPWEGPSCFRPGYVGPEPDFDLVRAGDAVFLLSSCESEIRLERRHPSTGAVETETSWALASEPPARLAVDAAGRLAVASWTSEAPYAVVRLFDPATLEDVRDEVVIESDLRPGFLQKLGLEVVADPDVPGRLAVLYKWVVRGGEGEQELARLDLCR